MGKVRADGWWYPWIFVAAMTVVVAVNGVMVAFALGTWTGLETEGYYEKGLAYNQDLAAARAQAERGWKLAFALDGVTAAGDSRSGRISAAFVDRDGKPLADLDVLAVILRPTSEGHDQQVALSPAGRGVYRAAVTFPLPGQWNVRIHAYRGDAVFQESHRVRLR
jgi:nitrogen fixation protein FixH